MLDEYTLELSNRSLVDIDRAHLIHPVSSFREHEALGPKILASGKGMWLTDINGHELLDAFAGLWCVNAGYGQESIAAAAFDQMRKLPYGSGYFRFTNEPAIRLAGKLVDLAPAGLDHVFFTLGGSDAIDSSYRYIIQYFNAIGKPSKKHIISQERGFHGSSAVGAGITGLPVFHRNFDLPHPWQHHIPPPYGYRSDAANDAELIAGSVANLRAKVEEVGGPDHVAAFYCEAVQGSGGVIVPPHGWLTAIRSTCTELGILLVVDEVITAFGRTGPMFACEHEGVSPDVMTLAKGLTSGYAPMGAVLMSDPIYQGIADGAPGGIPIANGFTYSGHPVSAAVALETLRLYTEGGILANGQKVAARFAAGLNEIADHPLVGDTRGKGLLGAIELVSDKASKARFDPSLKISHRLDEIAYRRGVIFRAFSDDMIGLAPALCCTNEEMDLIFTRIRETLDELLGVPDIRKAVVSTLH